MTATINASTTAGVVTTADTSGILQLQTNGTAALTVDASQNVGIGTSSPGAKFSLTSTGSTTADGVRLTFGSEARAHNIYSALSTGRDLTIAPYRALTINTGSGTAEGVLALNAYEYTTFGTGSSYTERARITSTGLVGINTTTPARTLHVKGGGVTTLANSNGALFTDASNAGVLLGSDNVLGYISGVTVAGNATADLVLQPFGGNVRVGTTAASVGRLDVVYTGTYGVYIAGPAGASTTMIFYSGGTNTGSISSNGSNTAFNTASDYRLKENIAPMTGCLAKVQALKPVTYKWKASGLESQGFIAHELAEVCPDAVTGEKDAMRTEQYEVTPAVTDEEGRIVTEAVMGTRTVPKYQGIDTSFLVATLTAAIQELKAIVDAQGAEIAALKGATA